MGVSYTTGAVLKLKDSSDARVSLGSCCSDQLLFCLKGTFTLIKLLPLFLFQKGVEIVFAYHQIPLSLPRCADSLPVS